MSDKNTKINSKVFKTDSLRKGLFVLLWIILWEVAALLVNRPIFFPTPIATIKRLAELVLTMSYWSSIGFSLGRIMLGFALGVFIGVVFAALSYNNKWFRDFISPFIHFLKVVPIAAIIILILLWIRSKNLSIVISFIMAMPIVYTNILEGLDSIDSDLKNMAKVFNLGLLKKTLFIAFPNCYPYIKSAISLSLSMCFKAGIAAELIGIPDKSIGEMLYNSKIYIDTDDLFAWTFTIILISYIVSKLVLFLLVLCKKGLGRCALISAPPKRRLPDGPAQIRITDVSKKFESKILFDGLCMDFEPGQLTTITNPSGWGKTTLLKIIMGLEESDKGSITMFNSRPISVVFQSDALVSSLSALENIAFVSGADIDTIKKSAEEIGLSSAELNTLVCNLSGGERRRVSVLRALLASHNLLILDEPFAGLDAKTRQLTRDFILDHSEGITTILVDHQ